MMDDILLKQYYNPTPKVFSAVSVVNLFPLNVQTGTDTLHTVEGFIGIYSTKITSSTAGNMTGERSLLVECPNLFPGEGVSMFDTHEEVLPGATYDLKIDMKGLSGGETLIMTIQHYGSSDNWLNYTPKEIVLTTSKAIYTSQVTFGANVYYTRVDVQTKVQGADKWYMDECYFTLVP